MITRKSKAVVVSFHLEDAAIAKGIERLPDSWARVLSNGQNHELIEFGLLETTVLK